MKYIKKKPYQYGKVNLDLLVLIDKMIDCLTNRHWTIGPSQIYT